MAQRVHTPTPKLLPVLGAPPRPGTSIPPMARLGERAIPRRRSGTGVSTGCIISPAVGNSRGPRTGMSAVVLVAAKGGRVGKAQYAHCHLDHLRLGSGHGGCISR